MATKTIPTPGRKASLRPDLRIVYDASQEGGERVRPAHEGVLATHPESRTLLVVSILCVIVFLVVSLKLEDVHEKRTIRTLEALPTKTITVDAGDSLWTIAQAHPVDGVSTPELVTWLMDENDLTSAVLSLGQSLTVPQTQAQDLSDA